MDNTGHRADDTSPFNPSAEKEYLSLDELVERIPYRAQTIRNLMSQGVLREGIHFFKPTQRKVIFKWSAICRWIGGKDRDEDQTIPLGRKR